MLASWRSIGVLSVLTLLMGFLVQAAGTAVRQAPAPGSEDTTPGAAQVSSTQGSVTLRNAAVSGRWRVSAGRFIAVDFEDRHGNRTLTLPPGAFALTLGDGRVIGADAMRVIRGPVAARLAPDPRASRLAERSAGQQVTVVLESAAPALRVTWRALLRDGSHYLRQTVTIEAKTQDVAIAGVRLFDLDAAGSRVVGTVKGSPVVSGNLFLGFEHPLSEARVDGTHVVAAIARGVPVRPGTPVTYSSVIGVVRSGQLRRDFLRYVERERAHPYRTFLHYNSWYDLGYFSQYDEAGALDRIAAFGEQLHVRRGVTLDSYLFDDGWDDHASLWRFNQGFPRGFAPLRDAAARYGAAPGIWLSPWGGYGKPKQERLAARPRRRIRNQRWRLRAVGSALFRALPADVPRSDWRRMASTSSRSTAPATSMRRFRGAASTATSPRRSA